jgi:hypothetical protein
MPEPQQPPAGGTPQPGAATQNPGTEGDPQYVTVADFGKTAAVISGLQKTLKELSGGVLTLDKLAEVGLLEKDDTGAFKPRGVKSEPPQQQQKRDDNDPVVQRLKTLEKQLADERREKEELAKAGLENEKRSSLVDALTKAGAINPGRDVVHIAAKFAKDADGKFVTKGRDKYGSEVDLTADEFAELFLKENPELRKTQSQPGSGTPSGAQQRQGGKPGQTVVPRAQWQDMNYFMANKAKFDSGEYVRGNS